METLHLLRLKNNGGEKMSEDEYHDADGRFRGYHNPKSMGGFDEDYKAIERVAKAWEDAGGGHYREIPAKVFSEKSKK
jgi:hypothetical protein